jgi:hypothetical protein
VHCFLQVDESHSLYELEQGLIACVGRLNFHPTADVSGVDGVGNAIAEDVAIWITCTQ